MKTKSIHDLQAQIKRIHARMPVAPGNQRISRLVRALRIYERYTSNILTNTPRNTPEPWDYQCPKNVYAAI